MKFFQGFYGFDLLSIFIILLYSILNLWTLTRVFALLLLLIVIYRTFSKAIAKRKAENNVFCRNLNKILKKVGLSIPTSLQTIDQAAFLQMSNSLKVTIHQMRKFKTVKCPGCHKKLKLPRGRGKVVITCKKCNTEFKTKV